MTNSLVNDIISLEDGTATEEEATATMQRLIDTGECWRLQGSYGRSAMAMIEAGQCHLPSAWKDGKKRALTPANMKKYAAQLKTPIRDYWGNVVPYREMLKEGTKGTLSYCKNMQENN